MNSVLAARDVRMLGAVLAFVLACGALSIGLVYSHHLTSGGPIRADGIGYYIYLPAAFLDHDLSLRRTVDREFGGDPTAAGELRPVRHGLLGAHGLGEAILLLPFFAAGEVIALASDASRTGWTWPYEYSAAAGGLVFAVAGLGFLAAFLRRWFSTGVVAATVLAITFGTSVFSYATYDSMYSHAFSFAFVALILWVTPRLVERPTLGRAATLGLALGFVTVLRPVNAVVALFPLVYAAMSLRREHRPVRLRTSLGPAAAGGLAFLVPVVPQLLFWHARTGHYIVNPYDPQQPALRVLHPHLLAVAFSVRKGLFFWAPLLALALLGLPILRRHSSALLVATATVLVVSYWLISSWTQWWYGGSFGQRPFVEFMPFYALCLAALLEWLRRTPLLVPGAVLVTAASLLTLHQMVEYWLGKIPFDATTWPTYVHALTAT